MTEELGDNYDVFDDSQSEVEETVESQETEIQTEETEEEAIKGEDQEEASDEEEVEPDEPPTSEETKEEPSSQHVPLAALKSVRQELIKIKEETLGFNCAQRS